MPAQLGDVDGRELLGDARRGPLQVRGSDIKAEKSELLGGQNLWRPLGHVQLSAHEHRPRRIASASACCSNARMNWQGCTPKASRRCGRSKTWPSSWLCGKPGTYSKEREKAYFDARFAAH